MRPNKDFLGDYQGNVNIIDRYNRETIEIKNGLIKERTIDDNKLKQAQEYVNDAKRTMIYNYFVNYNKNLNRNKNNIQCFCCKIWNDHLTSKCPNKFCTFRYEHGHLLKNCSKRNFANIVDPRNTPHLTVQKKKAEKRLK